MVKHLFGVMRAYPYRLPKEIFILRPDYLTPILAQGVHVLVKWQHTAFIFDNDIQSMNAFSNLMMWESIRSIVALSWQ